MPRSNLYELTRLALAPRAPPQGIRSQGRHCLRGFVDQQHEMLVHPDLQVAGVDVVGILSIGILDFHCYSIQAPKDEDLDEGEDEGPPEFRRPLRDHEGDEAPMNHEEALTRLRVGKGKGDR
eukprot:CAMPEP_0170570120 /NCGR_PEP_ID=MMETSP0224-20130122/934_1 /TAXON_ID=285029 /ORGANISM="Togula jolla, Strain CCCM 725" /LENGTH=121 /DNA_ID=CAMNT_0010892363 /DNA_START=710 /DNA_END=1075 /DNA_ORIENTATION=+